MPDIQFGKEYIKKGCLPLSYETYRSQLVSRLNEKLPPKMLNDVMQEIDALSNDYTFEKVCMDIIPADGIPEVVKFYIASMAVENCKKTTLSGYKYALINFFSTVRKPYASITANDVRCYLHKEETEKNWQPTTKEHARVILNSFFNWLVDNEYLNRNPMKSIKPTRLPKKKPQPLKQIELEIFRDACRTNREKALVDFLFSTGCRISEAIAMKIEDVDWRDRSVIIHHGKGDKQRITYFNAEAEISLRKYLDEREGNDNHLFVKTRAPYNEVTKEALEQEIRNIRDRVKDKLQIKVSPHTFRRTMGTTAIEHGCPIEKVKELLGHESLDTTMRYVTITQNEVKQAHSKYLAG